MVSFYSWGTFPETERCYQSYTKQVFCELAGVECEADHDRSKKSACIDVDCVWSEWSTTGSCKCTKEGGTGTQARKRSLNSSLENPAICGEETDVANCNDDCVPKDCTWGAWETVSQCKCGYGCP